MEHTLLAPPKTPLPTIAASTMSTNLPPQTPQPPLDFESLFKNLSAEFRSVNDSLSNEIKSVNTTIGTLNQNIENIRTDLQAHQDQIDSKVKDLEDQNLQLNSKLTFANERIMTLENLYFDIYQKQEAEFKGKQALNIIIRGMPEVQNERMHEVMSELLAPTQSIVYTKTNGATRLGRMPRPTADR